MEGGVGCCCCWPLAVSDESVEVEVLCPDDGESPARLDEQLLSAVVVHGGSRVDGSRRES